MTYNSAPLLRDLVSSLEIGLKGVEWSAAVADNASTDNTVDTIRSLLPECSVVQLPSNRGYAAGINAAIAKFDDFSAALILNPDVRLTAGCGQELMAALHNEKVGVAVPRLLDRRGNLIASMRREPTILRTIADALFGAERAGRWGSLGEMVTDDSLYDSPTLTAWAEGSTQAVSARCWAECGPWNESFFLYSEEADFDLRARDAGYAVLYTPTATAIHLEGDSAESPPLWSLVVANKVRLYRSRHGRIATVTFWVVVLGRELSRTLLGRDTSRAAVRALVSIRHWRTPPSPEWLKL